MLRKKLLTSVSVALGLLSSSLLLVPAVNAADHQEAPGASALLSADIGDYYAWHDGENLNLILTFGTFAAPGLPASFNSDVLYGMHFDTSAQADGVSDIDIYARFAQDESGAWGVQVSGADLTTLGGAVETVMSNDDMTIWAGLFRETVATGTISFDPTRDDVAGLNITAVAIQIPPTTIVEAGGSFQTWATTNSK